MMSLFDESLPNKNSYRHFFNFRLNFDNEILEQICRRSIWDSQKDSVLITWKIEKWINLHI